MEEITWFADPVEWFHRYKQIKRVIISELSVEEFEQKCIGKYILNSWFLLNLFILDYQIDLKNVLVFLMKYH